MKLSQLLKVTAKSKKRVGRGIGSGRGKTSGRGTKGQKARGKVPIGFIGGTLAIYKKLPYRRGFSRRHNNSRRSLEMITLRVDKLSVFGPGDEVTLEDLINKKLVDRGDALKRGVKIVSDGEIKISLKVNLPTTTAAAKKIEKAGGSVARG